MELSAALQEFTFDCRIRKLSKGSIENYCKSLQYLRRYLEEEHNVSAVEAVRAYHIKQFLAKKDEEHCKPQYINDLLKAYKVFFNYCVREEYIGKSPAANVHNMRQPKVKIQTFTEDDIRKLLNHFKGRHFLEIRNRTMLALFFDTGMRLREVLTMRADQIREGYILVHGKGNKERVVPVSPYLEKALMQYQSARRSFFELKCAFPDGCLFVSEQGRPLTPEAVSVMMKKAAEAVGVNPSIRVSPHTCRHTFAHLQLKNGLDIYSLSRLMGHENIAITQRYLEGIQDHEVLRAAQRTGVLANL